MKSLSILTLLFFSLGALADTPPPGTVKAKLWSGDGNTSIDATGTSINVDVTGSALPTNACKETGGNLAAILAALQGTLTVTGSITATNPSLGTPGSAVPSEATQVGGKDGSGNLQAIKVSSGGVVSVDGSGVTQPVSGTFWQATQPVSGTVTANAGTGTFTVDGSGHTQPISAASLPLPSGASTAAKQPALGIAGTPSSDVITVQGKSGMTAVVVDGSGVTQPVSGTFWQATQPVSGTVTANAGTGTFTVSGTVTANAGTGTFTVDGSGHTQPVSGTVTANVGTTNGLALDATVSGLQVAQGSTTSGQSGGLLQGAVTTSAPTYTTGKTDPFSLTTGGLLRVDASGASVPVTGTFWQATQPVSGTVTANAGTGTFTVDASGHTVPISAASLPLPSGAAQDTTVSGLQVAQGSTTSGQSGGMIQGAVTTSAPSYSTGKTDPLSLTTAGLLRVDASGTSVPVTGTFFQTTQPVSISGNQAVNVAQINGVTPLMGNGTTGTGSQRVTIASDNTAFDVNAKPKTPTALTVKQAAVTIGTSAVRLTNDGSAPASTRVLLVAQLVSTSTANCYFGSSTVTTTSTTRGVQMFPGQTFSFSLDAGDYYAICDASSQTFYITEQE